MSCSLLTVKGRLITVCGPDELLERFQALEYEQLRFPLFQARTALECQRGIVRGSLEYPGVGDQGWETEARFVQGSFPLYKLINVFLLNGYRLHQCPTPSVYVFLADAASSS